MAADLSMREYQALAEFRRHIRKFLQFSADEAKRHDIEPQQHQLLLAVKGLPEGCKPTIRELSERLQVQHHSAVELVNRLADNGAIKREHGDSDRREVFIRLTPRGESILRELSISHRAELEKAGPSLIKALTAAIRARRAA